MKNLAVRLRKSESKLDDYFSLAYSLIRFVSFKGNFIKSLKVYYKNEGSLKIYTGRLFFGFLSNRMSLDPGARGVFRIYKSGQVLINGNVRIARNCKIYVAGKLSIGNGTYINANTTIFSRTEVLIGQNCAISWNCQILDDDFHQIGTSQATKSIIIDDNVWIGANAILLKGIHIGRGSIIAAGSIVTKNVPPDCLVGGNPARIIKKEISWN